MVEDRMRELVERAKAGDERAFARLVEANADRLYAIAYRTTRDPHTAEDVVQGALVRMWRSLPSLRDPDRFEAWACRLVVNAAIDEARRRRGAVREIPLQAGETGGRAAPDQADVIADRDLLDRALARVTPEQRAVLALHAYLDMSQAQIADVLGIPVGTAGSRLHYALKALRAAVDAEQRGFDGMEVLA
jgi:RNA polymerase sigma-70 factor (ECF subfamily)